MKPRYRIVWLAPFTLAFLGAAPQADVQEWVRQGNEAFQREEYGTALRCFERAEVEATDPGLIAFNKGAAYYRLGKYRDAEDHFRRCLEDATGPRRARGLYNLANSLVRRAHGSEVGALREAVRSYEACLREGDADPDLVVDARDNLKVAREVLVRAEAARKNDPDRKDNRDDDPDNPRPPRNPSRGPGDESSDPGRGQGMEQGMQDPRNNGQQAVPVDQQPQPGAGQQPVLRDGESPPLSPQETETLLKAVENRIRREHGQRQRNTVPPAPRNERDW